MAKSWYTAQQESHKIVLCLTQKLLSCSFIQLVPSPLSLDDTMGSAVETQIRFYYFTKDHVCFLAFWPHRKSRGCAFIPTLLLSL